MKVYVVTGYELGWDCVVGVFDVSSVSLEDLQDEFPEDQYYINEKTISTKVD